MDEAAREEDLAEEKEPAAEAEALRASHVVEKAKMESYMFEWQPQIDFTFFVGIASVELNVYDTHRQRSL